MKNYVIINGVNSLTITGLAISKLPSISKPPLRVMTEEINGRDGDLITELGYGAYDKELVIGLYGNYDINEVIGFFNQEGTIVFSNEDDKYYNFKIINQIDYEALIKFRTATISLHCQPFKYPLTETPEEITTEYVEDEGETITLNDTKIAPLSIDLKGNTTQNGTPTPSSPVNVNVVSGDNEVVVCGKNLFNLNNVSGTNNGVAYSVNSNGELVLNGTLTSDRITITLSPTITLNGSYTFSKNASTGTITLKNSSYTNLFSIGGSAGNQTATVNDTITQIVIYASNGSVYSNQAIQLQLEKGSTATTYEPYTSQNYPLYLGVENLFNKDNSSQILTAFFSQESQIASTSNVKTLYIACKPNTTYTISKVASSRFRVMTTTTTPAVGVSGSGYTANDNGTKITITTGANANYLCVFYYNGSSDTKTEEEIRNSIQIEVGSKANTYNEYGASYIELNKIGTYQDYIYKDSGNWYLHKEVGKRKVLSTDNWSYWINGTQAVFVNYNFSNLYNYLGIPYCNYFEGVSAAENNYYAYLKGNNKFCFRYDNGTIDRAYFTKYDTTSLNDFKTWLNGINLYVYYVLATPTDTEITNTTLINQLEALRGAMSYEGQTNISQVNNDLPFILKVKGTKEGSGEGIINNIGNIYAKPIIALEGTGTIGIYKNGTQYFEVDMSNDSKITIDTENMEAYHNGVLKNRKVIGDYNKFTIDEGNNNIEITGELTKATISNYTRWL